MTRDVYRSLLANKKVGIAGCGGLGSNCAAALARAGVGSLLIADFDIVSEANLDRQFYFRDQVGMVKVEALSVNLRRIDPGLRVEALELRLDAEAIVRIFAGCDVLVEALDSAEAKAMLIEAAIAGLIGVPIVAASGIAGFGRSEAIRLRRLGTLWLVGDLESEVGPESPPMASRVGIAASMQADAVLEILLA
jgi:sulfur carrier protein ThiS adenylyltransferase